MRRMLSVVVALSLLAARGAQADLQSAQREASRSLVTFQKLITKDNYRAFGFSSIEEARDLSLGEVFRELGVRLDRLRAYRLPGDPRLLLNDSARYIFPVLSNNQLRSSIQVEEIGGRTRTARYGGPHLIALLDRTRRESSRQSGVPTGAYVAISVPALNLYFVGYPDGGELNFVPLVDDPGFQFRAGLAVPARQALARLVPAAMRHTGAPR